jgi:hypothetical protein
MVIYADVVLAVVSNNTHQAVRFAVTHAKQLAHRQI